ncbi:MAG: DUF6263 family protein [Bacteroidota bacterium]
MKRNTTLFTALLLALGLVFTACNKSGGGSGEKIQLEFNVEPGTVHKMLVKTDQTVAQKVMGMSQEVGNAIEMYIKQEVKAVDDQGVATVEVTYERVKMTMDNPMMGKQTYDSDNKDDEDSMLGMGYKGLIGNSFIMKMDKRAQVVDVSGVENLYGDLFDELGDEQLSAQLKNSFGPEAMKKNMQQMATVFPDVLIGEGDTWGAETGMAGEFGLNLETTYKVDLIDADKCVLAMESEVKTDEDAGIDMGGMKVSYDITGEQTGNIEVDRKTGLVIRGEMEQDLKGEVETMGMSVPMTIKSTITISSY